MNWRSWTLAVTMVAAASIPGSAQELRHSSLAAAASSAAQASPAAPALSLEQCIAQALTFGDLDDPASNVATLLEGNQHFRMHEELGTGPGFYYLWDKALPTGGIQALARLVDEAMELA